MILASFAAFIVFGIAIGALFFPAGGDFGGAFTGGIMGGLVGGALGLPGAPVTAYFVRIMRERQ